MLLLKKHYEKVILSVLLLIFVLLLGLQILTILRARDVDIDSVLGIKPPKPDYVKIAKDDPKYELMLALQSKNSLWSAANSKNSNVDLFDPPQLARCPFGLHFIPISDFPKQNAEKPGKCSFCGKDIRVFKSALIITADDSDGDGLPDKWELQYGLNPKDPTDAKGDVDTDGFTNLEEYQAGTDPLNPKSRPTYAKKLYTAEVVSVPLGLRLKHFGNAGENIPLENWDIQIETLRKNGRVLKQHFKSLGSNNTIVVNKRTYIIDAVQKDFVTEGQERINRSRIVLYEYDPKTKKKESLQIIGELGKSIVDPRKQITLYFTVDEKEQKGFVGDTIEFGDERRGIDKFIIKSGDVEKCTSQVQTDNGILETIAKKPAEKINLTLEDSPEGENPGEKNPKKTGRGRQNRKSADPGLPSFDNNKNKI